MTKSDKVIKGLEYCAASCKGAWDENNGCPYMADFIKLGADHNGRCVDLLCEDALALLKAQEPQATTHEAEWHIFKGRRGATCSYCKHTFNDVYDLENYDYYCRHCGARMVKIRTVKWE